MNHNERQITRRKALLEDIEHLYFTGIGILMCAISNWHAAILAALATVVVREILRGCEKKHERR